MDESPDSTDVVLLWFSSFLENDSVLRTRRETRCLRVQLKRSI